MEFKGIKKEYELLEDKILHSLKNVMRSGNFILGKEVKDLESKLADYVGVKHCVSCANATDGLILALMAAGVTRSDYVLVPAFSYIASASCVSLIGATPVFVDIDIDTYNISPESLKSVLISCEQKGITCKALIAVDLFGLPANYSEINKIAKEHGIIIIEDGAQGFGGNIGGKRACSFGDISVTSFFPVKPLGAYGDGGAIFTNNDYYAELIWSLRSHGRTRVDKYDNSIIGFNSRLDTMQAAILLEKFDLFVNYELKRINEIANEYSENLRDCVKVPPVPEKMFSSWAQYTIALSGEQQRDELKVFLKELSIPSMIYYSKPLHTQTALNNALVFVDLSNAEKASKRVLSLPIHPFMEEAEVRATINAVRSYFVSKEAL